MSEREHTPRCKKCYLRAIAAIKDLEVNLKTAFPHATEFDATHEKEVKTSSIGDISFMLGDCYIRMRFTGIGKQGWSRIASWERYKVAISSNGILNDTQVHEKAGKLDYEKIITIIKNRHQEYSDRENARIIAKTNRSVSEKVVADLKPQLDEIRGYTRIECQDDGSFKITLSSLDEGRLRRIVGALTIHHAK